MRKRVINQASQQNFNSDQKWLDIEKLALVEVTSEDDEFPIESALLPDQFLGWRASVPGKQIIRLLFDSPQSVKWIKLVFEEQSIERTQEYVLRWSRDEGQSYHEIIRQQWNFHPGNAALEVEDYQIDLDAVTILELEINPNIAKESAIASLKELRVA